MVKHRSLHLVEIINLKKYETLSAIEEVNEGKLAEICVDELLNVSNVCFVLVKPS